MLNKAYKKLKKTSNAFLNAISVISNKEKINQDTLDIFEEKLLLCDLGFELSDKIVEEVRNKPILNKDIKGSVKKIIKNFLKDISFNSENPSQIVMISGINGTGKTTTCAKLANYYKSAGKSVSIIGADTFRAAAQEQIAHWCEKNDINYFSNLSSKDPSSIIFEGLSLLEDKKKDVIIIDTAGRLHTSINLMNELAKMERVINKFNASYSSWISIDSTTGQNALSQIDLFQSSLKINGIILNKMDGTSKGGIALPIMSKYAIPVKFLGIGENIEDIVKFDLDNYLESLFYEEC